MANEDHSQVHHINQKKPTQNQSGQAQQPTQDLQKNQGQGQGDHSSNTSTRGK